MARLRTKGNKRSGGKSGKRKLTLWGLLRKGFFFLCVLLTLAMGYLGASLWGQIRLLPDVSILEKYEPIEAIQIFDRSDKLVCTVEGDEDR